jgi:SSS family solute:Na+ symporter
LFGLWFSRRNKNREDYFVAGRKLHWFVAGTSIVATYLAVDTPLAVSGFIRKGGIYENWFWWTAAFSGMFTVFFFARLWNRAGVLTDVEFIEFRYTGKAAVVLRQFNAFLRVFGLCVCNGWVILAVGKIVSACFNLPHTVSIASFNVNTNAVIYAILLVVTLSYTMFSGLWGVVMTDVLHFFAAMVGFILLAVIVVVKNNGPAQLVQNIINSPGVTPAVFDFFPNFKTATSLTIFTFFVYIGLLWWWSASGVGIVTQRMLACRDGRHAGLAVIWGFFCVVVVRTWPWIIVGLASLIYFPIIKGEDPELAFPKMMVKFLPGGMAGIVLAAFVAAFLSTIAANLNMAASYLMNDFYVRMIKPQAKGKGDYMIASRVATIIVLLLAIFITWQMNSIAGAWKYFAEIYAGTGFVMLIRWFWWRINAWTEISAMATSFILANVLKFVPILSPDNMFAVRYVIIIIVSTVVCLVVTFLTKPVESSHLEKFYKRVMPGGWWGAFGKTAGARETSASSCWIGWVISVITIYLGLFGSGYLCLAKYKMAAICGILFAIGTYFSVKEISKISSTIKETVKKTDGVKV